MLLTVEAKKFAKDKTRFSEFLNKILSSTAERTATSNNIEKLSANVRLPKLEIIKFTSEPTKWWNFIDSYQTAINSSPQLLKSLSNLDIT